MTAFDRNALNSMNNVAARSIWSSERFSRKYHVLIRNAHAVVHGYVTIPKMLDLGKVYFLATAGWHTPDRFTFLELNTLQPFVGPGAPWTAPRQRPLQVLVAMPVRVSKAISVGALSRKRFLK